jgi:hypothetical protein
MLCFMFIPRISGFDFTTVRNGSIVEGILCTRYTALSCSRTLMDAALKQSKGIDRFIQLCSSVAMLPFPSFNYPGPRVEWAITRNLGLAQLCKKINFQSSAKSWQHEHCAMKLSNPTPSPPELTASAPDTEVKLFG